MKQPTLQVGDLTVTMGDVEKLLAGDYWHDDISTYVDGNLIYRALNTTHKAATSATTWYIWKYTWTNGERTRREGPLVGSVDGQSDLAWAE